MSHTVTEVDVFTPTITVPDGTDSRSNAANVVEAIAQGLANRTKNLDTHCARFDETNIFDQGQQFNILNAAVPALFSISDAGDGGVPGNLWKVQLEFVLTDGTFARMYSGDGGSGNWCITTNAVWDASGAQAWHRDDNAQEANILRCFDGELHWYGKAAGVGTWTSVGWDTSRGVARIGDKVHAAGFAAVGLFEYETPPSRATMIALVEGEYSGGVLSGYGDYWQTSAGSDFAMFSLRLPHGATLAAVDFMFEAAAASPIVGKAFRRHSANWTTPVFPTVSQVGSDVLTSGLVGTEVLTVPFGITVDSAEEYWTALDMPGPGGDRLRAVRLRWVDPGPRNH